MPLSSPRTAPAAVPKAAPTAPTKPCAHCAAQHLTSPAGVMRDSGPWVCGNCGGWSSGRGAPSCLVCGESHTEGAHPEAPIDLPAILSGLQRPVPAGEATTVVRYLRSLTDRLSDSTVHEIVLIDIGEPVLTALPGPVLILGLGTLATLQDEAQLAFVVLRELALERSGAVRQRFAAAAAAVRTQSWWNRWRDGIDAPLRRALQLSLLAGYGQRLEVRADEEAYASVVAADYDPGACSAALRRLEVGSMAGNAPRFIGLSDRGGHLDRAAALEPLHSERRLNREVFRRAVGGFAVFGVSSRDPR